MNHVIVIGGGAAGLAACISAAREGAKVTLLEKNDRVGKKILSTGNGKCNLSNDRISPDHYHSDSDRESFLRFCERLETSEDLEFFESIGIIPCKRGDLYYPSSEQAASVLDALRFEAEALGVLVRTEREMTRDTIRKEVSEPFRKDDSVRVILATGGAAAPKTGSDGKGIFLAESLAGSDRKLSTIPFVPALVPIEVQSKPFLKNWAGVRVNGRITVEGTEVSSEGQLQLTDYGVSGIPAFQVSRAISRRLKSEPGAGLGVVLDLCTERELSELADLILNMKGHAPLLSGLLPKKLGEVILKESGISVNLRAGEVSEAQAEKIAEKIKRFVLPVKGTKGFDMAQVSAGGICLEELNENDWSLKKEPRIYVIGELADLDGDCGGYNLHHAWISGIAAGRSAARSER